MTPPPIVAALTHPLLGDAAVGAAILTELSLQLDRRVWLVDGVDPTDLLGIWAEAPIVVIVDACRDGADLGTLRRVDLTDSPPAFTSGRTVGVPEVLAVARTMDRAPRRTVWFGISVGPTETEAVSPDIEAAVSAASAAIVAELRPVLATQGQGLAVRAG